MTAMILHKENLSPDVFLFRLKAPLIAQQRQAGQFIMLQTDEDLGERIPLTIADADIEEGSITLIFQVVGQTTQELALFEVGDFIPVLVGPLGTPTHVEKVGHVVCVGGGIGVAPLHPIVQAFHAAGNQITTIQGARSQELLILESQMKSFSNQHITCTDDGSAGTQGYVTQQLQSICQTQSVDLVIAIGPPVMMQACAEVTRPFNIKTYASLNTIMVDGTGMCGGCRVNVGGKTQFVCVDGPEFDAHEVDFPNMIARLNSYKPKPRCNDCNMEKLAGA